MASSSKTINMPLLFAITIGTTVSLLATTMFGLAWYEYEARKVLKEQVLTGPTHDDTYDARHAAQLENLGDIDAAMIAIAAANAKDHEGHGEAVGAD